jgi:putative ABC transport system ATP-binding protein
MSQIDSSTLLLEARGVSHSFDYELFNNIEVSLKSKQKIAIVGASGCGKSTLLYILSTFLTPNSGSVKLLDKNIYTLKDKNILKIRRDNIGIIFQTHYLFRGFSAKENLQISSMLSSEDIDLELLEKFDIKHVLEQQIGELSGGQQQRVSIARVLSKKPKIIFADEPTGNLDSKTAKQVMALIYEYVDSVDGGLILVTHNMDIARECDVVYELKDKKLNILK